MEYINQMNIEKDKGSDIQEAVAKHVQAYRDSGVTYKDFLEWYKKDEESGGYKLKGGAPKALKGRPYFDIPEVLIPEDVPQEHLRVLK